MKLRSIILMYQVLTALSDGGTGVALILLPVWTLAMMGITVPPEVAPYIRYLGAFVLSTGIACAVGAWAIQRTCDHTLLASVWLLTAITRILVAAIVGMEVGMRFLDPHWAIVAAFDGTLAFIQLLALAKGWHRRALPF